MVKADPLIGLVNRLVIQLHFTLKDSRMAFDKAVNDIHEPLQKFDTMSAEGFI